MMPSNVRNLILIVRTQKDAYADLCVFFQNRATASKKIKRWNDLVQDCTKDAYADLCVFFQNRAAASKKLKRWN